MAPDPTPPAAVCAPSEVLLRRLLGGMSVFTLLMTLPLARSISPTPSTCPLTKWPPRRSDNRSAFSRFTGPGRSNPAVHSRVSCETSNESRLPFFFVTVRHAPCTQIESPFLTSFKGSFRASTTKGFTLTILPTACTMPVNIRASQ